MLIQFTDEIESLKFKGNVRPPFHVTLMSQGKLHIQILSIIPFTPSYSSYGPFPLSSRVKCVLNLKRNHAHIENQRALNIRLCDVGATHWPLLATELATI